MADENSWLNDATLSDSFGDTKAFQPFVKLEKLDIKKEIHIKEEPVPVAEFRQDQCSSETGNSGSDHTSPSLKSSKNPFLNKKHKFMVEAMQELCKDATICEDFANKCRYACPECHVSFSCWIDISKHMLATEHCTSSILNLKKFIVRPVAHCCKICKQKVLCDAHFLKCHLKIYHGIRRLLYSPSKQCKSHEVGIAAKRAIEDILKGAQVCTGLDKICSFQCPKCQEKFNAWTSIKTHLKRSGHYDTSVANIKNLLSTAVAYLCKICGQKMLCDSFFLRPHFRNVHNISLVQYKSVMKSQEELRLPLTYPQTQQSAARMVTKRRKTLASIAISSYLKEACADAKLSHDIGNKCKFKCPKCHSFFDAWYKLGIHLRGTKHAELSYKNVKALLARGVCHECQICNQKVLCDNEFLRRHLKIFHKITPTEYGKLLKSEDQGSLVLRQKDLKRAAQERVKDEVVNITKYFENVIKTKSISRTVREANSQALERVFEDASVSEDIGSKCTFSCPRCNRNFNGWKSLIEHFGKTQHGINSISRMPSYIQTAVKHVCKVCGKELVCDMYFIRPHIQGLHRVSLKDYSSSYGMYRFGCDVSEYEKNMEKCKSILNQSEQTDLVGDQCTFYCNGCDDAFTAAKAFVNHLRRSGHGKASFSYVNLLLSTMKSSILVHRCRLCSEKILSDKYFIFEHVTKKHKVKNIQEYCQRTGLEIKERKQRSYKLSSHIPTTKVVGNFCIFVCHKCQHQNNTREGLRAHMRSKGHKPKGRSFNIGNHIIKAVRHLCALCGAALLADYKTISGHITVKHNLNVDEYRDYIGKD